MTKIDDYLPKYDFSERHESIIMSAPDKVYEALQTVDFSQSIVVRFLFLLRGLKSGRFQQFIEHFSILYNEPSKEIILGLIARPWKLTEGFLHIPKDQFQDFNKPDYAKIVWNFTFEQLEKGTLVKTETRIMCTDKSSREKFRIYWFFVRPFSGLVRMEILRILRKSVKVMPF